MPLSPDELEPFLRLGLVQGVGHGRLAQLIDRFGSPETVLSASPAELRGVPGIGSELAGRIAGAGRPSGSAEARGAVRTLARLRAIGLTPEDPSYPSGFRCLDSPPYLLFAAGDLAALRLPGIAVVGTRAPSRYGAGVARRLSAELAASGFAIVSGLARGIDTSAHEGALEVEGIPVGVLGNGIEQVYPPENRQLFANVRERGLLITEYPPGETPKPGNFPRRNRLITALSEAVLVVEMGHKSGAQHTVAYALDQGKEVLAVPGQIGSQRSEGTNQLIRDGARLVTSAGEIIEELRGVGFSRAATTLPQRRRPSVSPARDVPDSPTLPLLTGVEEKVMMAIGPQPIHVDALVQQSGLPSSRLLATLLELELRGVIAALPGKRFARR